MKGVTVYKNLHQERVGDGGCFLSIVTRCMKPNPRPKSTKVMEASIINQTDKDFEQIFIEDTVKGGMLWANRNMALAAPHIRGDYVQMLDDDDYFTNMDFVKDMKAVVKQHNPDLIIFRCYIDLNSPYGKIYPTPDIWGKEPKPAKIGGICWIVRAELWKKYIKYFGIQRMGDFNMIKHLFKHEGINIHWHDAKYQIRTYKVGRGGQRNE